jgi:hypothetical protein
MVINHEFRMQNAQVMPNVVHHQLPNLDVAERCKMPVQRACRQQGAEATLKAILGTSETPLHLHQTLNGMVIRGHTIDIQTRLSD